MRAPAPAPGPRRRRGRRPGRAGLRRRRPAMSFTVAIDGPAAAGKGTISRALAPEFGFAHLDTGLLYRATGLKAARRPDEISEDACGGPRADRTRHRRDDLRTAEAGQAASRVAAIGEVRAALLLRWQRAFAAARGRCGDRRARHRHGDLPRGGREAVRHRLGRGARAPPARGTGGEGTKYRSAGHGRSRICARGTPATRAGRVALKAPPMRSCSTPAI